MQLQKNLNILSRIPKALVACEESQRVCVELRRVGIEAYSCDVLECSGGHPEWHIQQDVEKLLTPPVSFKTSDFTEHSVDKWDLIIAHPPYTYLTVAGNRYFYPNGYPAMLKNNPEAVNALIASRKAEREKAIAFFMKFTQLDCKHDDIVDSVVQGINWLKGLQPLKPTEVVQPNQRIIHKSGRSCDPWHYYTFSLPPTERARERSKTFPGIAKAMADTWRVMIMNECNGWNKK